MSDGGKALKFSCEQRREQNAESLESRPKGEMPHHPVFSGNAVEGGDRGKRRKWKKLRKHD